MESTWYSKKWAALGKNCQALNSEFKISKDEREFKQRKNKVSNLISNKGLNCFYTNADQFINKREDLLMAIADESPDIIFICEVIPKNQMNPIPEAAISIDGYNCLLNFDPNKTNLGASGIRGVAVYSRNLLDVREVEINVEGFSDHVWIEIPSCDKELILCGCIYRSPSNDTNLEGCMRSTNKIIELINAAYQRNNNLVIVGDFNYKQIDWTNDSVPQGQQHLMKFVNTLQDLYLYQHVSEPTRYRNGEKPNILDLILSSEEGMIQELQYLPPLGNSDHISMSFKTTLTQQQVNFPLSYNIYKTNYKAIQDVLRYKNWNEILNSNFSNDYDTFTNILNNLMKDHTPLKTQPKAKRCMYLTKEAMRLKNAKRRSWTRYVSTKTEYDRRMYTQRKNKLRALTRHLKRVFERNLATNAKKNPKQFWKYANSRLKTPPRIPTLTKTDGSKAATAQEKADTLNEFFSSVFTKEVLQNISCTNKRTTNEDLSTINITPGIVYEKLLKLNPNKSPGYDQWNPYFLRELADVVCVPLSILFNKSLKEGAHKSWLEAVIAPIYKKGDKSLPNNYRPVSLTSVISKMMESIVRDAIITHLMANNLISDSQHGFVPGRDCMTQLLLCMEDWTAILEKNKALDVIYTDFSKAFDSVAHNRLLLKLRSMGIAGDILNWIKSFLTGRSQCVKVDGETSKWKPVLSGVPQGSVIGPLLFVIFINDMPDEVKHSVCKLFADDCKLYGVVDGEDSASKLQSDLKNLEIWSKKWQLPFNTSKCKTLHLGFNNQYKRYQLNNEILEATPNEKDLGITMDGKLKFHTHASAVTKKANQVLGLVKKAYTSRDRTTISTLYKALVRPILEYGNVIWGPFYQVDIEMIESVQRRATKLVPDLSHLPYEKRLEHLRIPSLSYRRMRGDMIWVYKIRNGLVRIDCDKLFKPATVTYTRGHALKLQKKFAKKSQRTRTFSVRVINNWNNLPSHIAEASTLNKFKNLLDDHWQHLFYKCDIAR